MAKFLLGFIFLIFIVNFFFTFFFLYQSHPSLDVPMHMAGGAWLFLFVMYLLKERFGLLQNRSADRLFTWTLFLTFLVVAGWEFFEFISAQFLPDVLPGLEKRGFDFEDSALDILNSLTGAVIAFLFRKIHSK